MKPTCNVWKDGFGGLGLPSQSRGWQPCGLLPVLAKYVQSGDQRWAEAGVEMLKQYHTALKKRVEEDKWIWDFEWPAVLFPLYRQHLMEGNLMEANTPWFKDLVLYYCRNLHVWAEEPIEWRGGCHRSMPEGTIKWLAATWYPDIPEAEHWARYGQLVFNDFWKVKDVPQNDTGYMMGPLLMPLFHGDRLLGDDRVYRDAGMQQIFTRIMMEVTMMVLSIPMGPMVATIAQLIFGFLSWSVLLRKPAMVDTVMSPINS